MTARIYAAEPMLHVADIERTIAFYRDVLGMAVDSVWPQEGKPTWCAMKAGGARFMFTTFHRDDAVGRSMHLYMFGGVPALWEQVKDRAPVRQPLTTTEYGMLEFAITDPDGHELAIGQYTEEEPHDHDHEHPHDDHSHENDHLHA